MPIALIEVNGRVGRFEVPEGTTPEQAEMLALQAVDNMPPEQETPLERKGKVLGTSAVRGAAGLADMVVNAPMNALNVGKAGLSMAGVIPKGEGFFEGDEGFLPNTDLAGRLTSPNYYQDAPYFTQMAENAGLIKRENYPDDTPLEGVLDFTGQTIGSGGANPRNLVKGGAEGLPALWRAIKTETAKVLGEGIGGGGAGELVDALDTETEHPWIKMIAQVMGSTGGGMTPELIAPTEGRIAAQSLRNTTLDQQDQAQSLMDLSYAEGAPVTGAEALASVTGKNRLQDVQRVVEESKAGSEIMNPFMSARPQSNEELLARALGNISPASSAPETIPPRMAGAAQSAIDKAETARTNAVRPFYEAAATEQLPEQQIQEIIDLVSGKVSASQGGVGPESETADFLGNLLSKLQTTKQVEVIGESDGIPAISTKTVTAPQTYIGALDNAYQESRDALLRTPNNPKAPERTTKGVAGPIVTKLGETLETNPNIKAGRAEYIKQTEETVRPLKEGTVGQLAEKTPKPGEPVDPENLMSAQAEILMKKDPTTTTPAVITQTVKILNKENPTIAREWTRQQIQSTFDRMKRADNKETTGARTAKDLTGNPQQRANLEALVKASTGSDKAWDGFNNFLKIMEAQHKRLPVGSQTAGKLEVQGDMGKETIGTAALPGVRAAAKFFDNLRYGRNTKQMAQLLTDPKAIKRLQELARLDPGSNRAQILATSIIASMPDEVTEPRDTKDE